MKRRILHVDMDAFFAAVEQLDNKELRGKPVIIGGSSDRGVVATCSYEARIFGVHSAQAGFKAKKLCPNGIFIKGRMSRYSEISKEIFKIINGICDKVQIVSIDEAYLDVTDLYYSPMYIAKHIKKRVKDEIGLTLSVGISYNKFLAKLASDWNKPDGIKEITSDMVPEILKPLPIKKVHGLGKKSVIKLNKIGIFTIEDLLNYKKDFLEEFLGKAGGEIYDRVNGIDNRIVDPNEGERKSIGTETTLSSDSKDMKFLREKLLRFSKEISKSLIKKNISAKTITVKIKTDNFIQHTKSKTLNYYLCEYKEIYSIACDLLDECNLDSKIRLIGLTSSNFENKEQEQLNIFNLI